LECWRAGVQAERANTSVAKRSPALIEADKMEVILPEIDTDRAHGGAWCGFV
jgi:hypothetical protein